MTIADVVKINAFDILYGLKVFSGNQDGTAGNLTGIKFLVEIDQDLFIFNKTTFIFKNTRDLCYCFR